MPTLPINTRIAWIAQSALALIVSEANKTQPFESGGVLAGYWVIKGQELVITHSTGPGPGAIHLQTSFLPDSDYHTVKLAEIYNKSGRLCTYLGDWHSHPNGNCAPSALDQRTLKSISKYRAARIDVPIMGILAGETEWLFAIWSFNSRPGWIRRRNRIVAFQVQIFSA